MKWKTRYKLILILILFLPCLSRAITITQSDLEEFQKNHINPTLTLKCHPLIPRVLNVKDPELYRILCNISAEVFRVKVKKIIDGDTLEVSGLPEGYNETIRLIGIDTPETGEVCYLKAKEHLRELIDTKDIILLIEKENKKDKYGRTLGYVLTDDGVFVNAEMLKLECTEFQPWYPFNEEMKKYLEKVKRQANEYRNKEPGKRKKEDRKKEDNDLKEIDDYVFSITDGKITFTGGGDKYEILGVKLAFRFVNEFLDDLLSCRKSGQEGVKIFEHKKMKGKCIILIKGEDLSEFLLKCGLATLESTGLIDPYKTQYYNAQITAQRGRLGIWCAEFVSLSEDSSIHYDIKKLLEKIVSALKFHQDEKLSDWYANYVSKFLSIQRTSPIQD